MARRGAAVWAVAVFIALNLSQLECQPASGKVYSDAIDDPKSPDYILTAEHYPHYLLPERKIEEPATEKIPADVPRAEALQHSKQEVIIRSSEFGDIQFIAIVACCSALAAFMIVSTGYCVYRVHQNQRLTQDVDYPAYGVTGPMKNAMASPPADRKLAQSAQMYHFQHQKQQMIAVEKNQQAVLPSPANRRGSHSEGESDDEDKDYTVYECPGLAPGGQMEVRNPMFNERKASK